MDVLSLVHFNNCAVLDPSGRFFNLQRAAELGLEPNGEIGIAEPFSNMGFALALQIYDAAVGCLVFTSSEGPYHSELLGPSYSLSDSITKLEFLQRVLKREVRSGACGGVELYFCVPEARANPGKRGQNGQSGLSSYSCVTWTPGY